MNEKYHNTAFISIGSNLGDRLLNLQSAVDELFLNKSLTFISSSSIYETEPVIEKNDRAQANYLNAVISLATSLSPEELLRETQAVELKFGRPPIRKKNDPRTIDLDIIFFGNNVSHSKNLKIPHPKATERHFVLVPLCEVAEDYIHPQIGTTSKDLLKRLAASGVQAYISRRHGPIVPSMEKQQ